MPEFIVAILGLGAVIFVTSATSKLRSRSAYRDFRAGLRTTMLVPRRLLSAAGLILAGAEAATGVGLAGAVVALAAARSPAAFPLAESSLTVAVVLMATLAAGVAIVIRRGITTYCRCFGNNSTRPLGAGHLIRDLGLLLAFVAGLACCLLDHGRPAFTGWIVAVVVGVIVAVLLVRWDDLAYLITPSRSASQVSSVRSDNAERRDRGAS